MLKTLVVTTAIAIAPLTAGIAHAAPVQEDQPGWSCVDDGNRICGPGNPQGAPAGCYDDGGVLVAAWPCYVVVDANGNADAYTPDAR